VTDFLPIGSRPSQAIESIEVSLIFMFSFSDVCASANRFAQKHEKIVWKQRFGDAGVRPSVMAGVD